jgi:hypothetical protein
MALRCFEWVVACWVGVADSAPLASALFRRPREPAASGSRDAATLDDAKEGAQKRKVFERGHAENE